MSAATELATEFEAEYSTGPEFSPVDRPRRARQFDRARLATVTVLHPPGERAAAPPVQLTRRGVVVLGCAVMLVAGLLVWLARASAPQAPAARPAAPATVTVQPGDSLWSIATRAAPNRDPRAEVAELQRLNHLAGAALVPGQVLRTR